MDLFFFFFLGWWCSLVHKETRLKANPTEINHVGIPLTPNASSAPACAYNLNELEELLTYGG